MPQSMTPALTPEQWEARDYRQVARDLDAWSKSEPRASEDDSTEYVAKLGLNPAGSVIIMSRAHDRVLVPPPARAPLAALALLQQPLGFTRADVQALQAVAEQTQDPRTAAMLRGLGQRIECLLPPAA